MKKFFTVAAVIFFSFLASNVYGQKGTDALKAEATNQMNAGRFGEAIDLLNRYISANPQKADGYNLRGLCNEKRAVYEQAVYDYRSARKLEPNNKEINANLARATDAWYKLLYNKIEGHKREIAINPNKPVNYLEIGKSYKNLGEWATAEVWYDEYLKREEASPDEIIRYTEILAKNGHIKKGEPILKKYTDNHPEDHRLWSRYGYFLLWLGKNKMAIDAFEKALALRPFFREAMDGLDQAKGKGYIYTINDTSARYNYGMPVAAPGTEYAIDKYYRMLRRNPKDNATRYKLIEELVNHQRYGEAFDQIEVISKDPKYTEKIAQYKENVKAVRDSIFQGKIAEYEAKVQKNPADKEAVMQLADYYGGMQDYDKAIQIMDNYLANVPANEAKDVRLKYAKYATWNYQFEKAIDQLNILLNQEPNNLEYQLLRAQIAVWTVQDVDLAENYLNNNLKANPDNLQALVSLASMKIRQQKFDTAKDLLDKAKRLSPDSKEVEAIQIYYDGSVSNYEGLKIYQILYDARDLVAAGDCEGALPKYQDYFSKISGPTRLEQIEYANVNVCAKKFQTALDIYDKLLKEEWDFDLAVERGKVILWSGDSLKALDEFKKLVAERPDDYNAQLNLAIAYEYNQEWGKAEDIYDKLLEQTQDSSEIALINQRLAWHPTGGSFSGFINNFPSHIGVAPQVTYYNDNQNFQFSNVGGRAEFGITNFLTVGASLIRTNLKSYYSSRNLTAFKWQVFVTPVNKLTLSAGFGTLNTQYELKRDITDASVRYEDPDRLSIIGSYENTDARLLLYSPNLINLAFDADLYRINGLYKSKEGLKFQAQFSYLKIQDGNTGNDLIARIGKKFYQDVYFGYEYAYANYAVNSFFYYSPQNFDSHSLWIEWEAAKQKELKLTFGGKIGYVSLGDFIIREAFGDVTYNPLPYFFLSGRVSLGSTYRYSSSYSYVSAFISAYLSFH